MQWREVCVLVNELSDYNHYTLNYTILPFTLGKAPPPSTSWIDMFFHVLGAFFWISVKRHFSQNLWGLVTLKTRILLEGESSTKKHSLLQIYIISKYYELSSRMQLQPQFQSSVILPKLWFQWIEGEAAVFKLLSSGYRLRIIPVITTMSTCFINGASVWVIYLHLNLLVEDFKRLTCWKTVGPDS